MEKIDSLVDYCLNCLAKPCKKGCPLGNDIPSFIKAAKDGKFLDAFNILSETTVLAAICGRICPFRQLCEKNCIRSLKGEPVQIGKIEAYIGDKFLESDYPLFSNVLKDNGKKVAIVGAGPAGLSCAAFLRKLGYDVTIFEKYNYVGGIISHGIPSFRLSKEIALKSFSKIMDLGIKICFNKELGRNISAGKLRRKYDAVFLSFGANVSKIPNIKGKRLPNVYGANEFLESHKELEFHNKNVIIIGAGNVAMDMARTARSYGANVLVVYYRAQKDMKADSSLYKDALGEGIDFLFNTGLKQIIKDKHNYRSYLVTNEGLRFVYPCDYVFFAIGSKADLKVTKKLGLKLDLNGYVKTDKNLMTSTAGVFAGGDLIGQERSVAKAAWSGKEAAYNIDLYLKNN